ncbi:MAG: putative lipid II flippase FtsW [Oscillospiraceae bacterium]|nr:putative lipid II flippase FtsW [Oscillospiraceae bacterium]
MERTHTPETAESRPPKKGMFHWQSAPMDLPFAVLVVLISCIGLVMMFSASYAFASSANFSEGNPAYFLLRQGPYAVIGLIAMYVISRVNYQYFRALSIPLMLTAMILLALVPFIGTKINGAKRWIYFGPISVQPSEIAKIAMIVLFAAMMAADYQRMKTFRYGILPYAGILAVILGLLFLQPHLSAMVLVTGAGAVMLFAGGVHFRYFILGIGAAVPAGYAILQFMPHAQERLAIWRDPWLDPLGDGFQAIQSLLAIGSGSLLGVGLGASRQKYLYLPEGHNDFVFAIVCEELGLIGAGMVLLLFAILILRGYWIALKARDRFGSLLAVGVTTLLALQVFFNVAVVTGLVPVTGISMPFFSYGGSSLLIQMAAMGVVLSVSRQLSVGESV